MKKQYMTEQQAEWECQRVFRSRGPFCQVNTSHTETELIVVDEEDTGTMVSLIGYFALLLKVTVLAYHVMSTHLHVLYAASEEKAMNHMNSVLEQYGKYVWKKRGSFNVKKLAPKAFPINDLQQLRNETAYVIRNGFVARLDVQPFGILGGSGFLYYNELIPMMASRPFDELKLSEKRAILHMWDVQDLPDLRVMGKMVDPSCFVDYKLVEALYPNARKFVMSTMKNVEGQVAVAMSRGERPVLMDEELYAEIYRRCRQEHGLDGPSLLTVEQKKTMALELKREYSSANSQIARTLSLPLRVVDEMFPLSARNK